MSDISHNDQTVSVKTLSKSTKRPSYRHEGQIVFLTEMNFKQSIRLFKTYAEQRICKRYVSQ